MNKYQQICDYLESHLSETTDPEYVERLIKEYRQGNISDKKYRSNIPSELQCHQLSLAGQFSRLIKRNEDYEAYKKIYGKSYYLEPQQNENVWTKRVMGPKIFKKNGDFESINVSFFFPHFRSNDDIVKKSIGLMKESAVRGVFEKLNKPPLNYEIPLSFLEVRRCVYRRNFDEVMITIGLRKDILDLKERIELGEI